MKHIFPLVLFISASTILSCKKSKTVTPKTDIVYKSVNKTVKSSDTRALGVDINDDGVVDYSFFVQLTATSTGDHLYVGTNPLGENTTKMSAPDDERFLNMGDLQAVPTGIVINKNLLPVKSWSSDFAYLAVRNTDTTGPNTYEGSWGDAGEHLMPLQLNINGLTNYGWARLRFNKTSEELTFVDCAWNRNPGQEIKAGEK
jgi:hypothetical protein